jgi:ADP-ribosylglycohydrolase
MPDQRSTIELDQRYPPEELARIKLGLIPDQMEDKWFVYWQDETLFFHRSWTGICVYAVRFRCDDDGAAMVAADINRDPEECGTADDDDHAELIPYLIDVLLLRRPATYPSAQSSDAEEALEQWSVVGRAGLGVHPGDDAGGRGRIEVTYMPEPLAKMAEEKRLAELESRITGCLLGGAVGDALGAPVEFMSLDHIRRKFGPNGPADYAPWAGPIGGITDDTQMTLFTAEAMIRAYNRMRAKGIDPDWTSVFQGAYWRWLTTQGGVPDTERATDDYLTSWLTEVPELNHRRAPGTTCLNSLRSGDRGTPEEPINDRKGCGGVMRVAPAGLMSLSSNLSFEVGCLSAAVTHGHPSGWLAAGFLAGMLHEMLLGRGLREAADVALRELGQHHESREVSSSVQAALQLSQAGFPSAERVESLGAGWVAEEALAIGLYCALVADDFEHGVRLAITHSGDSDSTGSITGQLLGCSMGVRSIPDRWRSGLELRDIIEQVADDVYRTAYDPESLAPDDTYDFKRYPGW